jgi:cytidyltransferase-like protein
MILGYLAHGFDLINVRDLSLLGQARDACDELIVGVLSDEAVSAIYGRPPVVPLFERLALVQHLRGVARAVVHKEVPAGAVTFFSADSAQLGPPPGAVFLKPSCESQSTVLREALQPVAMREVVA